MLTSEERLGITALLAAHTDLIGVMVRVDGPRQKQSAQRLLLDTMAFQAGDWEHFQQYRVDGVVVPGEPEGDGDADPA